MPAHPLLDLHPHKTDPTMKAIHLKTTTCTASVRNRTITSG